MGGRWRLGPKERGRGARVGLGQEGGVVVLSTAQPGKKREREGKKKKRGGSVPPLISRPIFKERKREKRKRARVKRRGPCHSACANFLQKCKSTSVRKKIKIEFRWWWC
jgi:hypothetical protein